MKVRITELVTTTEERSFDVDVPEHVFHESEGKSVEDYREEWQQVHGEILHQESDVTNIEQVDE